MVMMTCGLFARHFVQRASIGSPAESATVSAVAGVSSGAAGVSTIFFGSLVRMWPIKTRENAGIYGTGVTIDVPEKEVRPSNSSIAVTSSPCGLKVGSDLIKDLVWVRI
jgi:hypothetical protein